MEAVRPATPPVVTLAAPWYKKRWGQNALIAAATILIAYGMIYVDVLARAREAFNRGSLYTRWHQNPDLKRQALEAKYLKAKERLEKKRDKGKLSAEEFSQELEVLSFDRDQAVAESAIKYAYQWYKDTYELFSPPESRWVRRARFLAPAAKQRWREELSAKNIPFEEYMLDLEPGEDAGTLMVFSTRRRGLAEKCAAALKAKSIEPTIFDAPAQGRLPQEGLKIIVPREKFWEAHDALKPLVDAPLSSEPPSL